MDMDKAHNPAQNTADAKRQCKAAKLTILDGIWKKNISLTPANGQTRGEATGMISMPFWSGFQKSLRKRQVEHPTCSFLSPPNPDRKASSTPTSSRQ